MAEEKKCIQDKLSAPTESVLEWVQENLSTFIACISLFIILFFYFLINQSWDSFLIEFVATVVGVLMSVSLSLDLFKGQQKKNAENLLKGIRYELEYIHENIHPSASEFPIPYMPEWDSAIMSGQLRLLSIEARKHLSLIYKKIDACGYSAAETRDAYEDQMAMNVLTTTTTTVVYNNSQTEEKNRVHQRHRFTIDRHNKIAAKLVEDIGKVLEMDFWEKPSS